MQQRIKALLKGSLLFIALAITFAIGFLSLIELKESIVKINHLDKLEHAAAYAVLCLSWLWYFKKYFSKKKLQCLIPFFCVFYGMIIEFMQETLTTYRTGSILDVFANMFGVLVGLYIFRLVYKKNPVI